MIGRLRQAYASFRGFNLPGSTVPAMDGPLKPNSKLDQMTIVLELPDIDNLTEWSGRLIASQGADLLELGLRPDGSRAIARRETLSHPIACLAARGEALALGFDGHGLLIRGGRHDGRRIEQAGGRALNCPTAAAFLDADRLVAVNGSAALPAAEWKRDLMSKGASGSVWMIDLASPEKPAVLLGDNLAFPNGLASDGAGGLFVSEAWRHRIIRLNTNGDKSQPIVLGDLPAYPGRIAPAAAGGYWLALFGPRNPLVEFVLNEPLYRLRMMERIEPDYWIAPSLLSGKSFLEPIQGGARKKLNELKPWSPVWSCGLVARCGPGFKPVESFHSRADGRIHGVTSLCEQGGALLVGAKGSGRIVSIEEGQVRR